MTSLVQPADVSWFKSIKADYCNRWTNWFTSNDIAFTKEGNLKSPGYTNVSFITFSLWEYRQLNGYHRPGKIWILKSSEIRLKTDNYAN